MHSSILGTDTSIDQLNIKNDLSKIYREFFHNYNVDKDKRENVKAK